MAHGEHEADGLPDHKFTDVTAIYRRSLPEGSSLPSRPVSDCRIGAFDWERWSFRRGTPNDAIAASLVRTRLALGPFVPMLRRLSLAPSIKQDKRVGEQVGLRGAGAGAQSRQPLALTDLERLDHLEPGMTLLRQFDRGVRQVATALVLGDELSRLLDEAMELSDRIVGAGGLDLRPNLVRLLSLVIEIFENEIVLRAEVAIERHLVGARRLGDGFDADAANAMTVEEVLSAVDDALAWLGLARRVSGAAGLVS